MSLLTREMSGILENNFIGLMPGSRMEEKENQTTNFPVKSNLRPKLFFLWAILFVLIVSWFYLNEGRKNNLALVNKPAPDFVLKDEKGNRVRLSDYQGSVVLVHFWAAWCGSCVEEFPLLNAFYKKMAGSPFVLLAISMDEGGMEAVREFRKMISFDFNVLLNPDQSVAESYGTYALPDSYLVNRDGIIVKKIMGPQNWNDPKWEKQIRNLMTE